MKNILSLLICLLISWSCKHEEMPPFMPFDEVGAFSYLESQDEFSEWVRLIRLAGLDESMDLKAITLTCFVVENDAVRAWMAKSGQTVENMTSEEARDMLFYHIIQGKAYTSSEFVNGRFVDSTASGEYLTTLFVSDGETGGVLVNGQVGFLRSDLNVINGVIHVLEDVLTPPTGTMLDIIQQDQYSIFKAMIDSTETGHLLEEMVTEHNLKSRRTLLIISDSIYKKADIDDIDELISTISPGNESYDAVDNPLNEYARYHMLLGYYTTLDFKEILEVRHSNPSGTFLRTQVDTCMIHLYDNGINFLFNPEAEGQSATFFGNNYNMSTENGVVHELDKMIKVATTPSDLTYIYDFTDPLNNPMLTSLSGYRKAGVWKVHTLEQDFVAPNITWSSAKSDALTYHVKDKVEGYVNDYVQYQITYHDALSFNLVKGDWFEIITPPIPKGKYKVDLNVRQIKDVGSVYQIMLDGVNFGEPQVGWTSTNTDKWKDFKDLDECEFTTTKTHTLRFVIQSGSQVDIDVIRFTPIID